MKKAVHLLALSTAVCIMIAPFAACNKSGKAEKKLSEQEESALNIAVKAAVVEARIRVEQAEKALKEEFQKQKQAFEANAAAVLKTMGQRLESLKKSEISVAAKEGSDAGDEIKKLQRIFDDADSKLREMIAIKDHEEWNEAKSELEKTIAKFEKEESKIASRKQ